MALLYKPGKKIIEETLLTLKERGNHVAQDARFNYEAPDGLRREVAFRDEDFLNHLSATQDECMVDSILEMLKKRKLVPTDAFYRKDAYDRLVKLTREDWFFPWTTFTRAMRRLFYMLSSVKQAKTVVGIGIFYGYTLAYSAAPSCGRDKAYSADKVYGIDINEKAIEGAKKNFSTLEGAEHVKLVAEDGRSFAECFDGTIDFLHLDADDGKNGKGLYLYLLRKLYPRLSAGAWVLAHDVTEPVFSKRGVFKEYLAYVRNAANFSESILFDIDNYGLELSIK